MRRRNPVLAGIVGLSVVLAMIVAGLSTGALRDAFGATSYDVEFAHAAGLKEGDPVRVTGIKVGRVTDITLRGSVVRVGLSVEDDLELGEATSAALKVETLLGTEYVSLDSQGSGRLRAGAVIPLERTRTPFALPTVLGGLTDRIEAIDTESLAQAFRVVAGTLDEAGPEVAAAVDGLSRLSVTVSSRDAQLRELLARSRGVSAVLADRSEQIVTLVEDAAAFLQVLEARRAAIEALLDGTQRLAAEITATARATRKDLQPALQALTSTVETLRKNKGDLEESIQLYAPLLRYYTTVLGQGRWFDAALFGLTPKVLPGTPPTTPVAPR